jgi:hypothetical protein
MYVLTSFESFNVKHLIYFIREKRGDINFRDREDKNLINMNIFFVIILPTFFVFSMIIVTIFKKVFKKIKTNKIQ